MHQHLINLFGRIEICISCDEQSATCPAITHFGWSMSTRSSILVLPLRRKMQRRIRLPWYSSNVCTSSYDRRDQSSVRERTSLTDAQGSQRVPIRDLEQLWLHCKWRYEMSCHVMSWRISNFQVPTSKPWNIPIFQHLTQFPNLPAYASTPHPFPLPPLLPLLLPPSLPNPFELATSNFASPTSPSHPPPPPKFPNVQRDVQLTNFSKIFSRNFCIFHQLSHFQDFVKFPTFLTFLTFWRSDFQFQVFNVELQISNLERGTFNVQSSFELRRRTQNTEHRNFPISQLHNFSPRSSTSPFSTSQNQTSKLRSSTPTSNFEYPTFNNKYDFRNSF